MDISGQGWRVLSGSCLDRLPELEDSSVDAVVCDPPYELGFMGKRWDSSSIAFDVRVWAECFRVLKPGGHLLAFGGTRTWHRIAVAVEDAGFDIRDSLAWLYGSGFPKSLDVSKAIDKAAGVERDVLTRLELDIFGEREVEILETRMNEPSGLVSVGQGKRTIIERKETAPATLDAQKWQGWGTALKPAFEPVIVARKPLIGTVAENVLTHGVGGLNIDGTRIGSEGGCAGAGARVFSNSLNGTFAKPVEGLGRWPSNVMLDEFTAALVDEQSGLSKSVSGKKQTPNTSQNSIGGFFYGTDNVVGHNDSGGASRFFYVAKASKRDRNEGLEGLENVSAADMVERVEDSAGMNSPRAGAGRTGGAKNFHPTVKPTDLMRQLVRLVTPPGGLVLDPFTGSGSTGKAAILEGFEFVGCELTDEYLPIIEGRLNHAVSMVETLAAEAEAREAETLF